MLVIGSVALKMNDIDVCRRITDIDVICTLDEMGEFYLRHANNIVHRQSTKYGESAFVNGSKPIEFELTDCRETSRELLDILMFNKIGIGYMTGLGGVCYAHPGVVLALKLSHRYLKNSPHFLKTMHDIVLLRDRGYTVPEYLHDWLARREKETLDYSHPNLNQKKGDFFDNRESFYVYDHDSIHEAVKHLYVPAYTYFKKEGVDVFCSKKEFELQPLYIRRLAVLEETYVLALERHQIPNEFKPDRKKSFLMALEKICTSITSGWFREFSWENYYAIKDMFSTNYVNRFHIALGAGEIKPFYPTVYPDTSSYHTQSNKEK